MSDDDTPPPETTDSVPPDSPSANKESRRRRLEGVIPEIVRRAVELGVEKAQEAPDSLKQLIGDLKLPKEIAHYLLSQIDETKNGLFRVVAKEIRDFLEHTNFAGEVQKLLTTVQFEVNTTIRFTPNDGRVDTKKKVKAPKEPVTDDDDFDDDDDDFDDDDFDDLPSTDQRTAPLPRPEVKTAVRVRRGERDGSRRRDRDP